MTTDILTITRTVNNFLDGLFFGFAMVTLSALIIFAFSKHKRVESFIRQSVTVARYLALVYIIFYVASMLYYVFTPDFQHHKARANNSYPWSYWFMILRPLVLCGFLQLLWIKKLKDNIWSIFAITLSVLICTLLSGAMIELFAIVLASYNRDYFSGETQYISDSTIFIISYIIEKSVLFSALVFIIWAIKREPKLK